MNINIVLSIENDIIRTGVKTIISDGIMAANIKSIEKTKLMPKIELKFYDIVIIEIKKNNKFHYDLINKILVADPHINFTSSLQEI